MEFLLCILVRFNSFVAHNCEYRVYAAAHCTDDVLVFTVKR